jgi:hypothetical protein
MRKLAVAAMVLGIAGVAAAAAVGAHRLASGQCPLTGRPIGHHHQPVSEFTMPAAVAAESAPASATDECPETTRHCCPNSHCCAKHAAVQEKQKPAETPAQNP